MSDKITRESLIKIGFRELQYRNSGNDLIYRLPFDRRISVNNLGTTNETVFICQNEYKNERKVTDLIIFRSFYQNGYCEQSDIEQLIKLFNVTK